MCKTCSETTPISSSRVFRVQEQTPCRTEHPPERSKPAAAVPMPVPFPFFPRNCKAMMRCSPMQQRKRRLLPAFASLWKGGWCSSTDAGRPPRRETRQRSIRDIGKGVTGRARRNPCGDIAVRLICGFVLATARARPPSSSSSLFAVRIASRLLLWVAVDP